METRAPRALEVLQIAKNFRDSAAEAGDTTYHQLMLRTAIELEELAHNMADANQLPIAG